MKDTAHLKLKISIQKKVILQNQLPVKLKKILILESSGI